MIRLFLYTCISGSDAGKSFFLDVEGAMSYAMVWLNGYLVGGWPFGYASWRLDLTPYVVPGGENQLAIRLDNPPGSSRWYPGGGIYRNVWLTRTDPIHVGQWGTFVTTSDVSKVSATINMIVVTPVHVTTSGDEAELFLNGKSLGRKKKDQYEYRLRWDEVKDEPGQLKVIAYKNGRKWAEDLVETTREPARLEAKADRETIRSDGKDLVFITVQITDNKKRIVPRSYNLVEFSIDGPGEIVATDNGDQTDMTPFPSNNRRAFNGLALVIVRSGKGDTGTITLTAKSPGLKEAVVKVKSR